MQSLVDDISVKQCGGSADLDLSDHYRALLLYVPLLAGLWLVYSGQPVVGEVLLVWAALKIGRIVSGRTGKTVVSDMAFLHVLTLETHSGRPSLS